MDKVCSCPEVNVTRKTQLHEIGGSSEIAARTFIKEETCEKWKTRTQSKERSRRPSAHATTLRSSSPHKTR
jgi:hypothetical protein